MKRGKDSSQKTSSKRFQAPTEDLFRLCRIPFNNEIDPSKIMIALRAVLARIEEEKREIHMHIRENVDKILMPILHALSFDLPQTQKKYVEMLKTNLDEITSPFISQLTNTHLSLTPTEINICNMIRNGLRTKEIAQLRNVSTATINRHREHIRRKLKHIKSDTNLVTYLQSSMWQRD